MECWWARKFFRSSLDKLQLMQTNEFVKELLDTINRIYHWIQNITIKCVHTSLSRERYNIRMTRIQEIAGTCQKNTKSFEEFFTALYRPLGTFTPSLDVLSSPILSSTSGFGHSGHPAFSIKTHSTSSLRSESLESIEESDEDSADVEGENANSNFSESESAGESSSEVDVKVRFKVPRIKIPQSRSTQYLYKIYIFLLFTFIYNKIIKLTSLDMLPHLQEKLLFQNLFCPRTLFK